MRIVVKTALYGARDILRGRWGIAFTLFLLLTTDLLFRLSGESVRVFVGLMNISLYAVPLVAIVYGTAYLYNSREFIELLLAQPVKRASVFTGLYLGLTLSLTASLLVGMGLPVAWHTQSNGVALGSYLLLFGTSGCLVFTFVGLAFLLALIFADKGKGLGAALLTWLVFCVVYDGLILTVVALCSEYPLERPMLVLSSLNPVDLARVMLLLHIDVAALLGYTGAVFQRFFSSSMGIIITAGSLIIWIMWPYLLGRACFSRKDL